MSMITAAKTDAAAFLRKPEFTAAELMAQEFPPIKELVPGIIQSGLVLLVAAPKIGKSWLSLGLALSAASGGYAFGCIPVAPARPVVYLALEDGARRLQNRLRRLGITLDNVPAGLSFVVNLPDDVSATKFVDTYYAAHRNEQPLVILDTLGRYKVTAPRRPNEPEFERDYRLLGELQRLTADCDGATLLVVHHTKKADEDDFVNAVSGTNGVAGAADAILRLSRRRNETTGTLEVTSRDGVEGEYAMDFTEQGAWLLQGGSLESSAQIARDRHQTGDVGDLMGDLIRYVEKHPEGVTPTQTAEALGTLSAKDASQYLGRAAKAERIRKAGRGLYKPVPADPLSKV